MKSGKRSKSSRLRISLFISALAFFFVYANVTAGTNAHEAQVTVLPDSELTAYITRDIANAKKSVYIAIYMFKSYENITSNAGQLKTALEKAADRGLDVYVIFDHAGDDGFVDKENMKTAKDLATHGIKAVMDSDKIRTHSKCTVIDGEITYIGSHNYTANALARNREISVRIVSEDVAKETLEHIKSIEQGGK